MPRPTLEEVQALGFPSLEACADHQVWLGRQAAQRVLIQTVIRDTQPSEDGSITYDMRGLTRQA